VKKLPTQLVEAFKSTLEETLRADLLLHVVDASHPEAEAQVLAVDRTLAEIERG
jgi:GTPase